MSYKANVKRVAVIGAGASGLAAIKACLEEDLEVVCFEMSSDIAGLWKYSPIVEDGRASVSNSTVTNTSKELSAFSDLPMPADFPNFLHHTRFLDYYRLYAREFGLLASIKFNSKVMKVSPDYGTSGRWSVTYVTTGKEAVTETFDAVMVCSGINWKPYTPFYKGLNDGSGKFKGEVLHGVEYRAPCEFENKRILVIGFGNSACDVAIELTSVAKQVYMSINDGRWCVTRLGANGMPLDLAITRFSTLLGKLFPSLMNYMHKKIVSKRFDHELYGLNPPKDFSIKRPTISDELPNRILTGHIIIKPKVVEFESSKKCSFADGTSVGDIDVVILATGYDVSVPFLDESLIYSKGSDFTHLYKSVFPPEHPTLAVIGFLGNRLALNPIFELQSRWSVRVFKKLCQLPSVQEMNLDIRRKHAAIRAKFDSKRKLASFETGFPYLEELAEQVGVKPNLEPKLWFQLYFGPASAYQYRLNGPNAKPDLARKLILTQYERILYPLNRKIVKKQRNESVFKKLFYITFCCSIFIYFLI